MVEKLFMTDGEIAKMLGLPHKHCQPALRALEKKGFHCQSRCSRTDATGPQ